MTETGLQIFGDQIRFQLTWRNYQKRILDEINLHLADRKLHVIAPPGSGKTVLGLETIRRLGQKALILSPTLGIRNQWIDRFKQLFSGSGSIPVSFNLSEPEVLTSITYQTLHFACKGKKTADSEEDTSESMTEIFPDRFDPVEMVKSCGITTIVLDEAHHLRTEWWKSLSDFLGRLDGITLVSLTATPPYDVSPEEWRKYSELCGPIDAEIAIPELIQTKDLCAHRDLIYVSELEKSASESAGLHEKNIRVCVAKILSDEVLPGLLSEHPFVVEPRWNRRAILSELEYFSGIARYLQFRGERKSLEFRRLFQLDSVDLKAPSDEEISILLNGMVYRDTATRDQAYVRKLASDFKQLGLVDGKRIRFDSKSAAEKALYHSPSKMAGICDIVRAEHETLQNGLRVVILTDHIQEEFLAPGKEADKIGAAPIFRVIFESPLCRERPGEIRLCVLTGSLCIVPTAVASSLNLAFEKKGAETSSLRLEPLAAYPGYSEVHLSVDHAAEISLVLTELFTSGAVNVLVGTRALLGEGWDCPAINVLILASFIGSYMTVNQMRGRALRTNPGQVGKTAHIWHLLCVDPHHLGNHADFEQLERRFRCFIGPDERDGLLKNGIERTGIGDLENSSAGIRAFNSATLNQVSDRNALNAFWIKATESGVPASLVRELLFPGFDQGRRFVLDTSARLIGGEILLSVSGVFFGFFRESVRMAGNMAGMDSRDILTFLSFAALGGILLLLPATLRFLFLMFRHWRLEDSFYQIGQTVLDSMALTGYLSHERKPVLETGKDPEGRYYAQLRKTGPYEESVFLSAFGDIVGPPGECRFLLEISVSGGRGKARFVRVPELFSRKREDAQVFLSNWIKHFGPATLMDSRNEKQLTKFFEAGRIGIVEKMERWSRVIETWK